MLENGQGLYMNNYLIRFNRGHNNTGLMWRVYENFDHGTEYLVKHLEINVPSQGNITFENQVESYNLYCEGYLAIVNGTATISNSPTIDVS
jgi:hypothetical protein